MLRFSTRPCARHLAKKGPYLPTVRRMAESVTTQRWPYCLSHADMVPKHESRGAQVPGKRKRRNERSPTTASTLGQVDLQFLGTASSQPTPTRAHNCLALRLDADVWMFDVGEGAQLQLTKSDIIRSGKINTIFITHLHGDHVFGLGPLVCSVCQTPGDGEVSKTDEFVKNGSSMDGEPIQLDIYGPRGTRAYLRNVLRYSYSFTGTRWRVHELLLPRERSLDRPDDILHPCEVLGHNIESERIDDSIVFRDILVDDEYRQKHSSITVHAAPIRHTVPTLGFVLEERDVEGTLPKEYVDRLKKFPELPLSLLREIKGGRQFTLPDGTTLDPPSRVRGRKLCILGDTCDPSNIANLARDSDLLVHEATNDLVACDPITKPGETYENVRKTTISHGHSTPQMAGAFAKRINAKNLILNHFSSRYRGDSTPLSKAIMEEIRGHAQSVIPESAVFTARDWSAFELHRNRKLSDKGVMSRFGN